MLLFATLALVMSLHQVTAEHRHKELIVSTPSGELRGAFMKTVLGRTIYSFRGIRYAKPPIGNLRFQPPVPINNWNGTYEATKDGAACPQANKNNTSEDCLFLNVYTTELPKKHFNPRRPVFVFIHPGGYYSMSGMSDTFAPDYFLDQNVVLVAFNYRLTSFGFMSTGDRVAPGNNGLKDQVTALRWVRKNVVAFGGDPNLVTIMGYSAGGASVSLHLVSPMSKGLFQRAMIMSGSSFGNWPVLPHQMELAQKQARFVGCPDDNSSVIYDCLMEKSVDEITDTLHLFREFAYDPIMRWLPVIEPDYGQERFLTDDPVKLLLEGKFEKVPVMSGITSGEFDYRAWYLLGNATWFKTMDQNFEEIAPISFIYERDTEKSQHISRELRKFYLGDKSLTNDSLPQIGQLYADGVIGFGVDKAAKLLSIYNTQPTYYYKFSYEGRYSFHYKPNTQIPEGAVHHDDLIYIFYIPRFPRFHVIDPEYSMVTKLTTLLYNFAVTGNPTKGSAPELNDIPWQPITPHNNVYMDIGTKLVMKKDLYQNRYSVWYKMFPIV